MKSQQNLDWKNRKRFADSKQNERLRPNTNGELVHSLTPLPPASEGWWKVIFLLCPPPGEGYPHPVLMEGTPIQSQHPNRRGYPHPVLAGGNTIQSQRGCTQSGPNRAVPGQVMMGVPLSGLDGGTSLQGDRAAQRVLATRRACPFCSPSRAFL